MAWDTDTCCDCGHGVRALLAAAAALAGATRQISVCSADLVHDLVRAGGSLASTVYREPDGEIYVIDSAELLAHGVTIVVIGSRRAPREGEIDRVPAWDEHCQRYRSGRAL